MDVGSDDAQPLARASGVRGELISPRAIAALRDNPRFREAAVAAINGVVTMYDGNRLLNRVINDRGRLFGGLVALYLHYDHAPDGRDAGLTVGRFQAFCSGRKFCSAGRARALLMLLRLEGYVIPGSRVADRRIRRLLPTESLIDVTARRLRNQFEALSFISPRHYAAIQRLDDPAFMAAFLRCLDKTHQAGFRVLQFAPELSSLVECNAGLLVMLALFLAGDGLHGDVPVSISALASRFGVARAHVRKLLAIAVENGLIRRSRDCAAVVVLPQLRDVICNFFAAVFALLAHCADFALSSSGEYVSPPLPTFS